jgi:hypothetical protein
MTREDLLKHEAAMLLFHTSAAITMSYIVKEMLEENKDDTEKQLLFASLDMGINEAASATERAVWYTMKDLFDDELKEFSSDNVIVFGEQEEQSS